MRLQLQDCGEHVLECLQSIEGLEPGDGNSFVAPQKLKKEALDSIVKAIGLLLQPDSPSGNAVNAACTLVLMCEPATRFALIELCPPEWMELLVRSDPAVEGAMGRAFKAAAHEAIHAKDYRQFFELVSGCDTAAASSFGKILPALTEEMVQGFDSDIFVQAMHMTLKSAHELHPHDCLNRLHSLLSIAGNLMEKNPGKALAMKCLIWPALDNLSETSDSIEVKRLQVMALLPELSEELLGGLPGSLLGEVLRLKVDQIMNWPGNEQKVDGLLQLAALFSAIGPELASGLESVIKEALEQWSGDLPPDDEVRTRLTRPEKGEILPVDFRESDFEKALNGGDLSTAARMVRDSWGLSLENRFRDLFEVVSVKLDDVGIDVQKCTATLDEEAAKKRISVVPEMAAVLLRTGWPYGVEIAARILALVDSRRGRFIQLLLREGLGIAGYSLSTQMARALPTLCDGDHSTELGVILESDQGKELVVQALKTDELKRLLIQRFIAGEPSQAGAARMILEKTGMWSEDAAFALLSTDANKLDIHSSALTVALLVLCSGKSEFDFLRENQPSQWVVAHIAMSCFDHGNPSAATVALLFEGLAHRLDLRDWMEADLTRMVGVARRIGAVKLGDQVVQGSDKWAPGWRLLLLASLDSRFCNPEWLAAALAIENSSSFERPPFGKPAETFRFLNALMSARLPGTDTPLFPADLTTGVMRTFLLRNYLAVGRDELMPLPPKEKVRWWKAIALIFNSAAFEIHMPAWVEHAVSALLSDLEAVEKELGHASLARIKKHFNVKS